MLKPKSAPTLMVTSTAMAAYRLLIGSIGSEDMQPVIVFINWLDTADGCESEDWQEVKSIAAIRRHCKLAERDIVYISENSLSKENPVQSLLLEAIQQLHQYQAGKRTQFELPLDMSLGTAFQQSVWQALQNIAYGDSISYAQLAASIGKPTAYRAVATANGKNPFSVIVPCHRVIASDGGLGGYTGGLDKKRWLLQLEQQ